MRGLALNSVLKATALIRAVGTRQFLALGVGQRGAFDHVQVLQGPFHTIPVDKKDHVAHARFLRKPGQKTVSVVRGCLIILAQAEHAGIAHGKTQLFHGAKRRGGAEIEPILLEPPRGLDVHGNAVAMGQDEHVFAEKPASALPVCRRARGPCREFVGVCRRQVYGQVFCKLEQRCR